MVSADVGIVNRLTTPLDLDNRADDCCPHRATAHVNPAASSVEIGVSLDTTGVASGPQVDVASAPERTAAPADTCADGGVKVALTQQVPAGCADAPEAPIQEPATDGRLPNGQFGPGNTASVKHWLFSGRVNAGQMASQRDAALALPEREAAIEADLGGDLSALKRGYVRAHVQLEIVEAHLWSNLMNFGVLTGKGRARAALNAWLRVQDRMHRSATTLGLERSPKHVSFADALHAATQRAQREAEGADHGD